MSGNEAWNTNVFLNADGRLTETGQISLSGRLFQMVGPATGKALPPTVDSFTLLANLLTFLAAVGMSFDSTHVCDTWPHAVGIASCSWLIYYCHLKI